MSPNREFRSSDPDEIARHLNAIAAGFSSPELGAAGSVQESGAISHNAGNLALSGAEVAARALEDAAEEAARRKEFLPFRRRPDDSQQEAPCEEQERVTAADFLAYVQSVHERIGSRSELVNNEMTGDLVMGQTQRTRADVAGQRTIMAFETTEDERPSAAIHLGELSEYRRTESSSYQMLSDGTVVRYDYTSPEADEVVTPPEPVPVSVVEFAELRGAIDAALPGAHTPRRRQGYLAPSAPGDIVYKNPSNDREP